MLKTLIQEKYQDLHKENQYTRFDKRFTRKWFSCTR